MEDMMLDFIGTTTIIRITYFNIRRRWPRMDVRKNSQITDKLHRNRPPIRKTTLFTDRERRKWKPIPKTKTPGTKPSREHINK